MKPITLFDATGFVMEIKDNTIIPGNTKDILLLGQDENDVARIPLVESKLNASVEMSTKTYGTRLNPFDGLFADPSKIFTGHAWYVGALSSGGSFNSIFQTSNFQPVNISPLNFTCSTYLVESTSASDAVGGTGVNSIIIRYAGSDGLHHNVAVNLNGTTGVTVSLPVPSRAIEMAFQTLTGSNQSAVGNIKFYRDGNLSDEEKASLGNFWNIGFQFGTGFTNPYGYFAESGKTYYINSLHFGTSNVSDTPNGQIRVDFWSTSGPRVFVNSIILDRFAFSTTAGSEHSISYDPPLSFTVPSGSIGSIQIGAQSTSASNISVWGSLEIYEMIT